ncbi:MAG: UDP-N-acetylmuramoyl-tripeptide--D-alanyl-D-alanine ligase [Candidatus Paceibacterota bacterium]|nr:MAG: UDP-N-acetylmuramoyl-tripeptide--D-alanyl-D-alanine ligase [Candidatus Paceibacterota bacterium]
MSYKRLTLEMILKALARVLVWRYKPLIIGVTGNVGKTSTKEAIATVVRTRMTVRASSGNLNNDIGLPLSILGDWGEVYYHEGPSFSFWARVIGVALRDCVVRNSAYPRALVLEYSADRPKDIARLVHLFKPHISVVTAVGDIPVHVEFFRSPDAVAREKSALVHALLPSDYAVLNADDARVLDMRLVTKARVRTFGSQQTASASFSHEAPWVEDGVVRGMVCKLHYDGGFVPVRVPGVLGRTTCYAVSAAAAVGHILHVNALAMSEAFSAYRPPAGRLRILSGIKHTTIIDDTYNAAPAATRMALETLRDMPAQRKVAVLGDMLELGSFTIEAHEAIGQMVPAIAQRLVCVGERAALIGRTAEQQMPQGAVQYAHTADEAKRMVQDLLEEGDLVLVKGSQGMRMEKVVEEIMAEPQLARELLVRQYGHWLAS